MANPRPTKLLFSLCVFVWLGGCTHYRIHHLSPPATAFQIQAIAVEPIEIHLKDGHYQGPLRTEVLLNQLWTETPWLVIPPSLFKIVNKEQHHFLRRTNLIVPIRKFGLAQNGVGVLRISITRRRMSGKAAMAGKSVRGDFEASLVISLELLDIAGDRLVDFELEAPYDPFEVAPGDDPYEALNEGLRAALRELGRVSKGKIAQNRPLNLPLRPSPGSRLLRSAPNATEGVKLTLLTFGYPQLPYASLKNYESTPTGACAVLSATGPLKQGDCIVAVNGSPLNSPHELGLWIFLNKSLHLKVRDTKTAIIRSEPFKP